MKRHSTDAVSLVFGIVFVAIAAWWAIDRYIFIDFDIPNLGWIAAGALILLGLLGVVASLRGDRPVEPAPGLDAPATDPWDRDLRPDPLTDTSAEHTVDTYPGGSEAASSEVDERP